MKWKNDYDEFCLYLFINISTNQMNKSSLSRWKNLTMKYPAFAKMTANVFAILITNVDIKKAFSLTRQIIDVNRVQLFLKTIKQIMMLKCFFSIVSFEKKYSFEFKQFLLKKWKQIAQIKINGQNKIISIIFVNAHSEKCEKWRKYKWYHWKWAKPEWNQSSDHIPIWSSILMSSVQTESRRFRAWKQIDMEKLHKLCDDMSQFIGLQETAEINAFALSLIKWLQWMIKKNAVKANTRSIQFLLERWMLRSGLKKWKNCVKYSLIHKNKLYARNCHKIYLCYSYCICFSMPTC